MYPHAFTLMWVLSVCATLVHAETNPSRLIPIAQLDPVSDFTSKRINDKVDNNHVVVAATNAANSTESFQTILTSMEFYLFAQSVNFIRDERCKRDLNGTLEAIVAGQQWAIAMYDASVKNVDGLQSAVFHQFGHYDQCLRQQQQFYDGMSSAASIIKGKYCLADVTFDGITVDSGARNQKQSSNSTTVHWGFCVPSTCSADDVATFMQNVLQRPKISVSESMCQQQYDAVLQLSPAMFGYACVVLSFVLLAVASTLYHFYVLWSGSTANHNGDAKQANRNQTLHMVLISFSVIENTRKIFQASKDQLGLNSINGIKALAMIFILGGHVISFIYGGSLYNVDFLNEQARVPFFAFISNSLLFVDVFLLLSGFLFCRILLIELARRRGNINPLILYLGRYIRLTPAYMVIIGFYMTWLPSLGSGPLWPQRILREQARCAQSWWLNILYINNYINTDKLCMFQSWYLSVDSQLFFVAPIVIYLLYRSRKHGLRLLVALALLTSCIPFVVTYVKKLDPTLLVYPDEISDLSSNPFYIGSYIKTHMRASAYIIGLLVGYLVHLMQQKNVKLPAYVVRLMWLFSVAVGVVSMFSISYFYSHSYNNLESTLYSGFHKLGWNLSVGWLVLAVTTGHGSWLGWLSHRFFAPISRLTYCAYLANGLVELYHTSSVRQPVYANYMTMFNSILSHSVNTFMAAFILCLLFESPIHALERILLRRKGGKDGTANSTKAQTPQPEHSQSPSTSEEHVA